MLTAYKAAVNLLYTVIWPYLAVKSRGDDEMWRQRRALDPEAYPPSKDESRRPLWLHASSVGEVRVLERLVTALKKMRPEMHYCVSTYTHTGQQLAREIFPDAAAVFYFPLDCHFPLHRLFAALRPAAVVIVETEIWPYFLDVCRRRKVPVLLANGRLSEKSAGRYRHVRGMLKRLFGVYRRFLMQTQADAVRIATIGAPPERIAVSGNIKHDPDPTIDRASCRREVRDSLKLAGDEALFIAASTRPGEEAIILEAMKRVERFPESTTLLLAPRHLERLDEVTALLKESRYAYNLYSDLASGGERSGRVILMDRMGVLSGLFFGAEAAFVGGTLADIGGHNLMEPVLAGVPVLYGPSLFNVAEAAERIERENLGLQISDAASLATTLNDALSGRREFVRLEPGRTEIADVTARAIIEEFGL